MSDDRIRKPRRRARRRADRPDAEPLRHRGDAGASHEADGALARIDRVLEDHDDQARERGRRRR